MSKGRIECGSEVIWRGKRAVVAATMGTDLRIRIAGEDRMIWVRREAVAVIQ